MLTCKYISLYIDKRNNAKYYLSLYYLSVQIEANIYGSVENTAKLNGDLIVIWNSRQLWTNQTSSDISKCNTIGHRAEASGAVLSFEYTQTNISLTSQKDLYSEIFSHLKIQ